MVYVYIADIADFPDPLECPEIMKGLPEERVNKIRKYKQVKDRKQSLGAGLLLLKVFEEQGRFPKEITYGFNGKPEAEGIQFNLSHSQDKAVCVVGEKPVGVDIEKVEEIRENIAKRFFTTKENAYLDQFCEEERKREFFRLWTMKESYMKMTGEGMKLSLDRFEFDLGETIKVYRDGTLCDCYIKEYDVPGYRLTVCAGEDRFAEQIENLYFY